MTYLIRRPFEPAAAPSRWQRALQAGAIGLIWLPALAADGSSATAREIERLYRGGESAAAMQRVEREIADHPSDPALRFLRGVMLIESRRADEAIAVFEALTRDYPEMPEPYNNLAVLQADRGEIDRARTLLEEALRRDPDYATAQENLGDVLVRQARRAYEAAAAAPRSPPSLQRKLQWLRSIATANPAATR